jgi:hypothetical protein
MSAVSSFLSALAPLVTSNNLTAAANLIGSTFGNNAWTTVQPLFAQLQVVAGTPAAASICDKIASTPGVPAAAVVLLEKIPSLTDPLAFQQYIATAEQIIQNSGTTLATALTRVQLPAA